MRLATLLIAAATALAPWAFAADPAPRTGEQIVKAKCASCHEKGLQGAPRMNDREAWTPRLKKGLDATVTSAIRGHGAMPARGGMAGVTDEEFRSAVVYLFNANFPPPKPAKPAPLGPNQRVVDGTEVYLGVKPVREGTYVVNVTLRDATTHAIVSDAQVEVGVTNPVMGGQTRKLERVSEGGNVSYRGEFMMSGKEPHVITVQVRRKDRQRTIETKFDFKG